MKKTIAIMCAASVFMMGAEALAAESAALMTSDGKELKIVTNSLEEGGEAVFSEDGYDGKALELDGSYGVYVGEVTNKFSVSAMVKITSDGNNDTIFFKNMGDKELQKWTGVQSKSGKAAFWSHGSDGRNKTVVFESKEANVTEWSHVVYTENAGVGKIYINGILMGKGNVANGAGSLYVGATYWEEDAPKGYIDDVKVFDRELSYEEIFNMYYDEYAKGPICVPDIASEAVEDIALMTKLGVKDVTWESSDESVITKDGKVTRGDEDKTVVLKAFIDGKVTNEFTVTVPKKAQTVNDDIIASYVFDEKDGGVIHDASGNGNHATAYNKLKIDENGAYFDGMDDYIKLPNGLINGHDDLTIVFKAAPEKEQQHIFAYVFGNTNSTGYMFLNTSRPGNNEVRFAGTKEGSGQEQAVYYAPGVAAGTEASVVVTLKGTTAAMYLDGELLMEGDIGMTASDLGETTANYIGKSLYDSDGYFKGYVKEFTIYNRAMSAEEVKDIK